ncbi:amidohydrolase family protein [Streptomyces phytohabitans]|uniref:amidohydrolase family protein n=1 Tax=Streptomyces phytohabitans TaxID=1150371 RepID=UPI00345C4131
MHPTATAPPDLVIRGAHVFDGRAALPGLYNVAVSGTDVSAVSAVSAASARPPRGVREVDAAGGWVVPGLIDTHVHLYDVAAVTDEASLRAFERDRLPGLLGRFPRYGVTTVRSVGDPAEAVLGTRARIAAGTVPGPRLLATGPGITGRDGHPAATVLRRNPWARARFAAEVDGVREMRDLVHRLADQGVDAVKLLSEGACAHGDAPGYVWRVPPFPDAVPLVRLPRDLLRAGVEAGHERGLRVTVHTTQQAAAREAVEAGTDGLEHGVTVEPLTDDGLVTLLRDRGVTYVPTLWAHDANHPHLRGNVRKLAAAGVHVALGSDSFTGHGTFGANTLEEAALMVAAGMTPTQSLAAGTSGAARQLGRPDLGAVAPGKCADLLLLGADPTTDIGNLRELRLTVLDGGIVTGERASTGHPTSRRPPTGRP